MIKNLSDYLGLPADLDLADVMKKFQGNCAAYVVYEADHGPKTSKLVTDKDAQVLVTLTKELSKMKKKLNKRQKTVNASVTTVAGAAKAAKDKLVCTFCKATRHDAEHCWKNPNASDEVKAEGDKMRASWAKKAGFASADANPVTTQPSADSELASMMHSGISDIILLDGGSDSIIFNCFYHHLFRRLSLCDRTLTGIGGLTGKRITLQGDIEFMGILIKDALFCSSISKSVVSEGLLCRDYGFKVEKVGSTCTIISQINNTTAEVTLLPGKLQYVLPITLFEHDSECHSINLASVRPSNPKTLWHGRFGHAYLGVIIKMARSLTYKERGLILPEALIKKDPDEDLCDSCALGKPTFSFAYVPQFRSETKAKLWYMDVSGGGNLSPSLVYGNKFMFHIADS